MTHSFTPEGKRQAAIKERLVLRKAGLAHYFPCSESSKPDLQPANHKLMISLSLCYKSTLKS